MALVAFVHGPSSGWRDRDLTLAYQGRQDRSRGGNEGSDRAATSVLGSRSWLGDPGLAPSHPRKLLPLTGTVTVVPYGRAEVKKQKPNGTASRIAETSSATSGRPGAHRRSTAYSQRTRAVGTMMSALLGVLCSRMGVALLDHRPISCRPPQISGLPGEQDNQPRCDQWLRCLTPTRRRLVPGSDTT
jgi:hypothetical protein